MRNGFTGQEKTATTGNIGAYLIPTCDGAKGMKPYFREYKPFDRGLSQTEELRFPY